MYITHDTHTIFVYFRDNATLRFCEAYAHEFPMSDTFKIVLKMVEKTVNNRLDVRRSFESFDKSSSSRTTKNGWLDQVKFISALDSWGLSSSLNDQELITVLRRFQYQIPTGQGNSGQSQTSSSTVYLYHEISDLFSHMFIAQQAYTSQKGDRRGLTTTNNHNRVGDLSELLNFLRTRTTQVCNNVLCVL